MNNILLVVINYVWNGEVEFQILNNSIKGMGALYILKKMMNIKNENSRTLV